MTAPAGGRTGQGRLLALKLRGYLRPKAVALLLDSSLSGPQAPRVAIFQCFLLAAMKAHVFAVAAGIRSERVVGGAVASAVAYMARAALPTTALNPAACVRAKHSSHNWVLIPGMRVALSFRLPLRRNSWRRA